MTPELLAFVAVLLLPVAWIASIRRTADIETYLTNKGGNPRLAVALSAVAGNVGIGTFVVLFLFSAQSPLIGLSVAAAYGVGLLLCAAFAPVIRSQSASMGVTGIVDFIAVGNSVNRPLVIWLCVAVVFVLRSAVQLSALALVLSELTGMPAFLSIGLAGALIGAYSVIGGYRAAILTDIAQSTILLFAMVLLAIGFTLNGIWARAPSGESLFFLGPYEPVFLFGIWLFLPTAPLLAVDNWHRITTANSDHDARSGFLIAAACCVPIYGMICLLGMTSGGSDVIAALAAAMPAGLSFVAYAAIAATIMSSVDTFIVPLMSTIARRGLALDGIRRVVAILFLGSGIVALLSGSVLDTVVAAFNSMVVLLPAVLAVFFRRFRSGPAALWSILFGTGTSIAVTFIDPERAAIAGFLVSTIVFVLVRRSRLEWV